MDIRVKQEILEALGMPAPSRGNGDITARLAAVIQLSSSSSSTSSSDSDSDSDDGNNSGLEGARVSLSGDGVAKKKRKLDELGVVLPVGFLAPLPSAPPPDAPAVLADPQSTGNGCVKLTGQSCKQFWKAGDYEGAPCDVWNSSAGGIDHVRVHPKFLHSNATSHKWALGAFAELLDNSLDEVCNGATYVNMDMLESRKDESRMILIEDNGGGMDPDKMRQCMSLGYSAKSKLANTIGQYGNGFKTSTMRLGADVIVFSRCCGKDGISPTQSIGLLSYTFLRSTGKEDIVVPMLDYEREGQGWKKMIRFSTSDWNRNLETILQWSPFFSEADLLCQFNVMADHGTRIIIYNLWEDDQGLLELDFDADPHDIQLRGVNRDEKNIKMAKEFPNSRHFLTYRHSLRSYASILYLRLPLRFRIILRGKDVDHHNIVNDMMLSQKITYRPQPGANGALKDVDMAAVVTVGFVKDAKYHIDVQGFNVYHKNRLIKPFWRVWNAAGSDGRGVIGVLEANFVEPAHDKQGFERTTVLARLEARLSLMQKTYWSTYCHKIGYAPRRNKKNIETADTETYSEYNPHSSSQSKKKYTALSSKTAPSAEKSGYWNGHFSGKGENIARTPTKYGKGTKSPQTPSTLAGDVSDDGMHTLPATPVHGSTQKTYDGNKSSEKKGLHTTELSCSEDAGSQQDCMSGGVTVRRVTRSPSKAGYSDLREHTLSEPFLHTIDQLKQENHELKERLEKREGEIQAELVHSLQCEKCKSVETQLQEAQQKIEELNKEQESLIDIFSEERDRRDKEEDNLRKKLKDASNTIQDLLDKVRLLEKMRSSNGKPVR